MHVVRNVEQRAAGFPQKKPCLVPMAGRRKRWIVRLLMTVDFIDLWRALSVRPSLPVVPVMRMVR